MPSPPQRLGFPGPASGGAKNLHLYPASGRAAALKSAAQESDRGAAQVASDLQVATFSKANPTSEMNVHHVFYFTQNNLSLFQHTDIK